MNEGDIILCAVQSATGSAKVRPAIVLRTLPTYSDFLTCGISSQLWQEIKGFDEVLVPDSTNNLRTPSVIRLSFLAVVQPSSVRGTIGRIPSSILASLKQRLANYLTAF